MTIRYIFDEKETQETIELINTLSPATKALWGKMNVTQMLAHCNVAYEIVYTDKHPKPKGFEKFMIKLFAKNAVVGPKAYPKNERTAPVFLNYGRGGFRIGKTKPASAFAQNTRIGCKPF